MTRRESYPRHNREVLGGVQLDDFIQGPEGAKLQGAFDVGMKDMGVPSTMIKTAAQKLLKTYLFNRLTQPSSSN